MAGGSLTQCQVPKRYGPNRSSGGTVDSSAHLSPACKPYPPDVHRASFSVNWRALDHLGGGCDVKRCFRNTNTSGGGGRPGGATEWFLPAVSAVQATSLPLFEVPTALPLHHMLHLVQLAAFAPPWLGAPFSMALSHPLPGCLMEFSMAQVGSNTGSDVRLSVIAAARDRRDLC